MTGAPFNTVMYERHDGIASVTLNRPDELNIYNVRMRDELFEVFSAISDDDEVRVVTLRGAGRAFCAGADLTEFGTVPSPTIGRRVRFARDVWRVLYELPMPKIAVLHGYAFGSGLELALFCDLRIAADDTLFAFPEVRLGMIPAAGGTQTLPRVVGTAHALDWLITGRRVSAAEAYQHGLLSKVVPPDELQAEAERAANAIAALPMDAVRALLQAVREGSELPIEAALRLEARLATGLRSVGAS